MQILLEIIIPVFGIVAIGYAAVKFGLFPEAANKGLARFVFDFAIPAMLFRAMATMTLPESVDWGYIVSYYGGGGITWIIGSAISLALFRSGGLSAMIMGMSGAFSNTVLLGVPLVLTTYGEQATLPVFLLIAFHSSLLITTATVQAEITLGSKGALRELPWNIFKGLIRNPIIVSLVLGVAFNLSGLSLPHAIDTITETLGRASLPSAVFAMGASLASYQVRGALSASLTGVGLKLIIHPLMVWVLASYVFEIDPLWRDIAVIIAALPIGVNVYLMAERYQSAVTEAAASLLISAALSVGSVAMVLYWLDVR